MGGLQAGAGCRRGGAAGVQVGELSLMFREIGPWLIDSHRIDRFLSTGYFNCCRVVGFKVWAMRPSVGGLDSSGPASLWFGM